MFKYKVLLVDDEEEVTNMIEERIDWVGLGFEVAGKAQNGVKALELSEKVQPDVVITETKKPKEDTKIITCNLYKAGKSRSAYSHSDRI